jgi:hypothetical protein
MSTDFLSRMAMGRSIASGKVTVAEVGAFCESIS